MLKLSANPPISPLANERRSVFEGVDPSVTPWAALYTRPRQEKAMAFDLLALGVDYFLPLVKRVTISGGRKRTGLQPLFPSYLFASMAEATKLSVLRTNRIVQTVVPTPTQRGKFVDELRAIEAAVLSCPEQIDLQPRVVEGARARITGGAMRGVEGVVVKSDNRTKIWLQVTALGTGVLVEIESDLLEPAE